MVRSRCAANGTNHHIIKPVTANHSPREVVTAVLVALVIGLLGGAGLTWSFHLRAEKRLVQQRDSLVAQTVRLDSVLTEARRDTQLIVEQRDVVRWRAGRVDSLLDTLVLAAPDTLKPLIESLASTLRSERRDRDSLVALLQSQIVLWRDSIAPALTRQRDRAMHLLDTSIRKGSRKCGLGISGPATLSSNGARWGIGAGISCRL